jgi:hypothetical protein
MWSLKSFASDSPYDDTSKIKEDKGTQRTIMKSITMDDTRTPPATEPPLAGVLLAVLFNYLSAERGRRQVTWVGNMTHSDKGTKRNDLGRFDGNNKTTTITSSSSLDVDR